MGVGISTSDDNRKKRLAIDLAYVPYTGNGLVTVLTPQKYDPATGIWTDPKGSLSTDPTVIALDAVNQISNPTISPTVALASKPTIRFQRVTAPSNDYSKSLKGRIEVNSLEWSLVFMYSNSASTLTTSERTLFYMTADDGSTLAFYTARASGKVGIRCNGTVYESTLTAANSIKTGIVITYNANTGTLKIYANGNESPVLSQTGLTFKKFFGSIIFGSNTTGVSLFDGYLAAFYPYSRVLDAGEAVSHTNLLSYQFS